MELISSILEVLFVHHVDKIYQLYMKNIPHIDLFDEENDPRTKYIAIRYNSHPTPIEASNCKNQYGLDRNKYTNYINFSKNKI